jgi:putative membrane protein
MHPLAAGAAIVAALVHVWFFAMESLLFLRPRVWSRFGLRSQQDADIVRSFAFNQGFYNLFLAIGVAIGIALIATGATEAGRAILLFGCGSMVAAGIVLVLHNTAFFRAAAIQIGPALIAIFTTWLLAP